MFMMVVKMMMGHVFQCVIKICLHSIGAKPINHASQNNITMIISSHISFKGYEVRLPNQWIFRTTQ